MMMHDEPTATNELNVHVTRRYGDRTLPLFEKIRKYLANLGLARRSLWSIAWKKHRRLIVECADNEFEIRRLVRSHECLNSCQSGVLRRGALAQRAPRCRSHDEIAAISVLVTRPSTLRQAVTTSGMIRSAFSAQGPRTAAADSDRFLDSFSVPADGCGAVFGC
jgi:hypothetical protein